MFQTRDGSTNWRNLKKELKPQYIVDRIQTKHLIWYIYPIVIEPQSSCLSPPQISINASSF